MKHLPLNEFDLVGITNIANRFKEAGLGADYEIGRKAEGIVYITLKNPAHAARMVRGEGLVGGPVVVESARR